MYLPLPSFFFFSLFQAEEAPIDDLMELVQEIVAFHMKVCLYNKTVDKLCLNLLWTPSHSFL